MTTVKTFLVTASCGLVLLGAVAAQAISLRYVSVHGGPICFASPDVRVIDAQHDIPFSGTLTAVLVPTYAECTCPVVGMIFDDRTTLIVDCLHSDDEVDGFLATAHDNAIATVRKLTTSILAPCPPPTNQATLADWRGMLFRKYRPR